VPAVLADIAEVLKTALTSWQYVARLSVFSVQVRSSRVAEGIVAKSKSIGSRKTEFQFVDGFAYDKV
jgi:hypothetical protein